MGESSIAFKTVLNWRFYIGFPILMVMLLIAILLELISKPCKFIYKSTKRISESINYSKRLKRFTKWTLKN